MSRRALVAVFALFVGAPLLFLGVGLLLPGTVVVERSIDLPVPPTEVFTRLDSAREWMNYQRRERNVGQLEFEVTGLAEGVGSGLQYYLSGKLIATYVIRATEPDARIDYGFSWESAPVSGHGSFLLEETNTGTRLTRREHLKIGPDPVYRWIGLGADMVGKDFEAFFEKLKSDLP
ncbi:MAG: SRPBCC family protein [Myxococcota bacterium]